MVATHLPRRVLKPDAVKDTSVAMAWVREVDVVEEDGTIDIGQERAGSFGGFTVFKVQQVYQLR
jgi:hypothetical protein